MKKYIFSTCVFFITTSILASHMYHTEGVVKNALGKHSSKVPVYNSSNSNNPTGSTYIRAGKISGYHIGTFSHTTRKKTRKGTFTIKTITKSVIEDNAQHPLAQTSIAGATKSIIGFVRNPHYSIQAPTASPKNIPLYEYTGKIPSQSSAQNN